MSWWKFYALIVADSSVKEMLSFSLYYVQFFRTSFMLVSLFLPCIFILRRKYVDRPFWCEIRSSVIDRQRCRDDENVSSAEAPELYTQLAPCCVNERVHGRIIEILLPVQWALSLGINEVLYCILHRHQVLPCVIFLCNGR